MADSEPDVTTRLVDFRTEDGEALVGDCAVPSTATGTTAAAIVCHPHPQFGGNRFNTVVSALFDALPAAGIAALRFDFRHEFGAGIAEQLDATAAIDVLADTVGPDVPLLGIGYSFGAMVVLGLDDPRLAGKVLVAPPLGTVELAAGMPVPTLVMTPAHDQFAPPAVVAPIVADWPDTTIETVDMADHFLAGRTGVVVDRTIDWISRQRLRSRP